jgi:hypothetical protein
MDLKAKFESILSYLSFKHIIPGAIIVGLIGSTRTALPSMGIPQPLVKMPVPLSQ